MISPINRKPSLPGLGHGSTLFTRILAWSAPQMQEPLSISSLPTPKVQHVREQMTRGVFCVPSGSASSPSSKYLYRLSAPLRWWRDSTMRRVVEECRMFPFRIQALLTAPHRHIGVRLGSPYPSGYGLENPCAEYKYQESCSEHMQQLLRENRWAVILDMRIAAESYRQGATWALRNICNVQRSVGES